MGATTLTLEAAFTKIGESGIATRLACRRHASKFSSFQFFWGISGWCWLLVDDFSPGQGPPRTWLKLATASGRFLRSPGSRSLPSTRSFTKPSDYTIEAANCNPSSGDCSSADGGAECHDNDGDDDGDSDDGDGDGDDDGEDGDHDGDDDDAGTRADDGDALADMTAMLAAIVVGTHCHVSPVMNTAKR